jgi:ProP effector
MSDSNSKFNPLIMLFAARWPKCLAVCENRRRPLAVGIHNEMIAALDGVVSKTAIGRALGYYVGSPRYIEALKAGMPRIGLDGEPVGFVTEDQERSAARRIKKKRKRQQANKNRQHLAPRPFLRPANADKPRLSLKIGGRS